MSLKIQPYKPVREEEFMNPKMRSYFKEKLTSWKLQVEDEYRELIAGMKNINNSVVPDDYDRASNSELLINNMAQQERSLNLINQINSAIKRIEDGSYGYCLKTSEPIEIERLIARPIALYSLYVQEMQESRSPRRFIRPSYAKAYM